MRAVRLPTDRLPADRRPARTRRSAVSVALLGAVTGLLVAPPPGVGAAATARTAPSRSVTVTFDTPGSTPRPLKESVQPIRAASAGLAMTIRSITYPGIVCGFTFRGRRPAAPVTIRVSGTARNGRFDSGPLKIEWNAAAQPKVSAGASTDQRSGWTFSAEAHANRNGPGWVVSAGGVPLQKEKVGKPSSASCALTAAPGTSFVPANGPVGYWAGFATA